MWVRSEVALGVLTRHRHAARMSAPFLSLKLFCMQVFEMDKKLLQVHAMPYIAAYTWEKGTLMRALDMDEFLPPRTGGVPEEELRLRSRRLPRRQQRKMRYYEALTTSHCKMGLSICRIGCYILI